MSRIERDLPEEAAEWLEKAGYEGDLSAITACLHDIHEAMQNINTRMLPSLIKLDYPQREEALDVLIELWLELEHIRRHAEDGVKNLSEVRDYFDTSQKSGAEV